MERSQLSDLMANVQRMHSDLERSNENDRKRLDSQVQMLENQTYVVTNSFDMVIRANVLSSQDLRTQLTQERDSVRHLTLQKDIELKDLRSRMEKSVC